MMNMENAARAAKTASLQMAQLPTKTKNAALVQMAADLNTRKTEIIAANHKDLEAAAANHLAAPLLKRLRFDDAKIAAAVEGLHSLVELTDPVGEVLRGTELDQGLELFQVRCPIGVIGVIFESRPDALVQIASLCLKSGNAALLKGGQEALHTNRVLAEILSPATARHTIPDGWLALMDSRENVREMLALEEMIDLIIPRGSNEFVRYIMDNTSIPVLGHADGICHVYVDRAADVEMALNIAVDSKTQYVAVCNAMETLLVHEAVAARFLPDFQKRMTERGGTLRGCEKTRRIIQTAAASDEDWRTEYLDLILSIRVVDNMNQAVDHINHYGSGHTEVIVTRDKTRAMAFMNSVDAADVFHNCSSRFADGFRFGLGAEVGISTTKIHARGPVGLAGLTSYKWRLFGNGQVVEDYSGENARPFTHRPIHSREN